VFPRVAATRASAAKPEKSKGRPRGKSLEPLLRISRAIDQFNSHLGRYLSWLVVVAVVVSSVNATVRKVFDTSSNSYLELQWVLFSIVFLCCAPWTLLVNEHIRIDIVNSRFPLRVRSWIELLGHIFFLMPFALILLYYGIPFFLRSWRINEQSFSAGGLPQWPAKSLIMIGFAFLVLQGISEIIKRIAIMQGILPDPNAVSGPTATELEAERLLTAIGPEAGSAPPSNI
jgi:TRAP-type mannitol/chloroaromatic compound transport system permease small subunit